MKKQIDYKAMGVRIRSTREAANMTQEQLAEVCGLSAAHIGHIERGTRIPSLESLLQIAKTLQISMDYLLFDSVEADAGMFVSLGAILKQKDPTKVHVFLTTVKALADKIDDL